MAFMMPVVKNDYQIYSKSPPRQKVAINNGKSSNKKKLEQRHSINVAMLQHTNNKINNITKNANGQIVIRVHSKSVSESPKKFLISRSRTSSNNTSIANSIASDDSEIIQNLMVLKLSASENDGLTRNGSKKIILTKQLVDVSNSKQSKLNLFQTAKHYWTNHIFKQRKRTTSQNSSSNSVS